MSVEDLDFAVRLTDTMNWQLTEEDFEFMLQLEPEGCFTLTEDNKRIGLLTTISFDGMGWIGNVIVDEKHRRKGAGPILVEHAVDYLIKKRVNTVGLYAYLNAVNFYRRLGFTYDSDFIVLHGKGSLSKIEVTTNIRMAEKKDLHEIIAHDGSCMGVSRGKLLEPILLNTDNSCYLMTRDGGIVGYVSAKVYKGLAELGPLVCGKGDSEVAVDLLKAIIGRLESFELSACLPKKETTVVGFLTDSGFRESFRVARMFFGTPRVHDCVYMAESLERG
jgi:GNAT superfamily N-acetyltransferase